MDLGHNFDGAFWAPAFGSLLFEEFCRTFFRWYCPLQVEGRQHLPEEPFLLCSNHSSHADSAALMTASGRSFRRLALVGASDYFFHSRRRRWSVSPLMNVIPIERQPGSKSLTACLATCRRFLQHTGGVLILYPEGTRSLDGKMQTFKSGVGLFALELGVPVVPAYIEGTHQILPKGRSMPRPGPVTVRFGKAISFAQLGSARTFGELSRDRRRQVVEQLARNIRMLRPGSEARELVVQTQEKG